MSKKVSKTAKKDLWFKPVRGSYLPRSWQAWSLYFISTVYILAPLPIALYDDTQSVIIVFTSFISRILLVGVALTWLAQKKS